MPDRLMGIYTIRNTTTGRIYVGSSSDIETRWERHRGVLFRGRSVNAALLVDWRSASLRGRCEAIRSLTGYFASLRLESR